MQLAVSAILVGFCAGVSVSVAWQRLIRGGLTDGLPYLVLALFFLLIAVRCGTKLAGIPATHVESEPQNRTTAEEGQAPVNETARTTIDEEGTMARCCFCNGKATPPLCELTLKSFTIGDWHTAQSTWCHVQCLREHLHEDSRSLLD